MNFMCLLAPFNVQNFQIFLEWIRSLEDTLDLELWSQTIFGPKMAHLPKIFFLEKTLN